jgi:hypothetical protein
VRGPYDLEDAWRGGVSPVIESHKFKTKDNLLFSRRLPPVLNYSITRIKNHSPDVQTVHRTVSAPKARTLFMPFHRLQALAEQNYPITQLLNQQSLNP